MSWKLFCWTCGGELPETVIVPAEGYALPGYTRKGGCCCVETEAPPVVRGCTDPTATNYNSNATTEDGSCAFGALASGCTNPIAQNFDPDAQTDDGLCIIYPHAVFTYVVDGFDVEFDAGLSTDDGTIVGYSWDFGDGSAPGTGIAPSHTYAARGNYVVTLTVTDDDGNTDSTSQIIPITENAPPVACFVWSAAGLVATFDGGCSTDSDGTIVSWAWNFGDGFTGSGETLNHTYTTDGTYTITLTVTDDGGLTDFVQQSIAFSGGVLNVPPVAAFTHAETDLDVDVDASTSTDSDGVIVSWDWDYGDGGTGTGETDSHTYAAAGTYNVTLTVTDDGGATDSVSHDVTVVTAVNDLPVAAFTWSFVDDIETLEPDFDASGSSDTDGTIVSWDWDFGDGNTGTGETTSHAYAGPGNYEVTLTVTDNDGGEGSVTHTVVTVGFYNVPGNWVTPVGVNTWLARGFEQELVKIRASDSAILATYNIGLYMASGICFDGAHVWVPTSASGSDPWGITKVLESDGSVVGTYGAFTAPGGLCFDGVSAVWVTDTGANQVKKITVSTGSVAGPFTVADVPRGVCVAGSNIFVALDNGDIAKLDLSGTVLANYPIGLTPPPGPTKIIFDGMNLWVLRATDVVEMSVTGTVIGSYNYAPVINNAGAFSGTDLWLGRDTDYVDKVDISDGSLLTSYLRGIGTYDMCQNGGYIWALHGSTYTKQAI